MSYFCPLLQLPPPPNSSSAQHSFFPDSMHVRYGALSCLGQYTVEGITSNNNTTCICTVYKAYGTIDVPERPHVGGGARGRQRLALKQMARHLGRAHLGCHEPRGARWHSVQRLGLKPKARGGGGRGREHGGESVSNASSVEYGFQRCVQPVHHKSCQTRVAEHSG